MKVFDELISKTYALLPDVTASYTDLPDASKFLGRKNDIILGKETAYELGGSGNACAVYSLYTQDDNLCHQDEVVVIGKDIKDIKRDCAFARIAVIKVDDIDANGEQEAYNVLEAINLRKYDVYPDGFMVRTSVLSNREQVRVSKKAIKNKLSFRDVGKLYIDQFKRNPHVLAVKMIFITLDNINYLELERLGDLSIDLFRALNHVLADIKMDCKHCEWKVVCDEVEGMKEMHQQMINNKKK